MADPITEIRIHELEQKLAAMPGSRAFVALAEEYRRAGRQDEALATLTKGLQAHPGYLSAQIAIARLYQEMGKIPEAVVSFQNVLVADRQNLVAAKSLADLYRSQGELLEALKKYKLYRALSADPDADELIAELERELHAPPGGLAAAPLAPVATPEPAPEPPPEPFLLEDVPVEVGGPTPNAGEGNLMEEPGEYPAPETEPAAERIPASRTLADLYYDQGHFEDARRIYERLAQADPGNESLARRAKMVAGEPTERMKSEAGAGSAREQRVAALRAWLARVGARPSGV